MTLDAFRHTLEFTQHEGSPDSQKPWLFEDIPCQSDSDSFHILQSYILSESSPHPLDKAFILSDTPLGINDASTSSVSPVQESFRLSSLLEETDDECQYGVPTSANNLSEEDDSFEGPMWSPGVDKLLDPKNKIVRSRKSLANLLQTPVPNKPVVYSSRLRTVISSGNACMQSITQSVGSSPALTYAQIHGKRSTPTMQPVRPPFRPAGASRTTSSIQLSHKAQPSRTPLPSLSRPRGPQLATASRAKARLDRTSIM